MALISLNNLERFFNNLKTYISNALNSKANSTHTHTTADISNLAENWNVTGTNLDISFAGSSNNNGQLSIQINSTDITTFTANQITNSTFNLNFNSFGYNLIPATDNAYNLGDSTYGFASFYVNKIYLKGNTIFNVADDNYICLGGATAQANGANLVLNGKNRSTSTGEFKLEARDGTNTRQLIGKPDGTLSWSGGEISADADSKWISINGGSKDVNGGYVVVYGKNYPDTAGCFKLVANNGVLSYKILIGYPDGSLKWNGTYILPTNNGTCQLGSSGSRWKEIWCTQSSINSSSDERQKQQIKPIDNDLLDAWENVNPIEFKWNDAVAKKGDNARVHTGYIAQNIQQALTENGVNPNDYGLFLYDEWGEEQEEKDEQGNIVRPYKPSGNAYGLRYTECLVVECAYLRKQIELLQERLNKLEEK